MYKKRAVLWLLLVLILISGSILCFYFYQSHQARQAAEALEQSYRERLEEMERANAEREAAEASKEVAEASVEVPTRLVPQHLQEFAAQNPDFVGIISIPALNQTYPVVQAADNDYYLDHDFQGQPSQYGTIYVDYRVDLSDRAPNIILYGHNMLDGQMFGQLTHLARPEIFTTEPQVIFDTVYGTLDFRIFATHVVQHTETEYLKTKFNHATYQAYIDNLNSVSSPPVQTAATIDNRLITLVTCNDYDYETRRFLAHGILKSVTVQP